MELWIFIFLALLQAILCYISYSAASDDLPTAKELHEEYITSGENESQAFFSKLDFKHEKLISGIVAAGFLFFLLPFLAPASEEESGPSVFFLIGGAALVMLTEYLLNQNKKKRKQIKEEFVKLLKNEHPPCIWENFTPETSAMLSSLIRAEYYNRAAQWMTDEEKDIVKQEAYISNQHEEKRRCLKKIIENGYTLPPPDDLIRWRHPILGIRKKHTPEEAR